MSWKDTVKALLEERLDAPVQDFATVADDRKKSNAVSCIDQAYGVILLEDWIYHIDELRSHLDDGLIASWGHRTYENNCEVREMVVTQGQSQFDMIHFMETTGNDTDLSTSDIVSKLIDLHNRYTLNIFLVTYDEVAFELKTIPDDLYALAQEMFEFCPDCVHQGAGSLEKLVESYQKSIKHFQTLAIFLWWD